MWLVAMEKISSLWNSESVNELWRFSQQAAFDSFYMVFNKIPAFGNIKGLQI